MPVSMCASDGADVNWLALLLPAAVRLPRNATTATTSETPPNSALTTLPILSPVSRRRSSLVNANVATPTTASPQATPVAHHHQFLLPTRLESFATSST